MVQIPSDPALALYPKPAVDAPAAAGGDPADAFAALLAALGGDTAAPLQAAQAGVEIPTATGAAPADAFGALFTVGEAAPPPQIAQAGVEAAGPNVLAAPAAASVPPPQLSLPGVNAGPIPLAAFVIQPESQGDAATAPRTPALVGQTVRVSKDTSEVAKPADDAQDGSTQDSAVDSLPFGLVPWLPVAPASLPSENTEAMTGPLPPQGIADSPRREAAGTAQMILSPNLTGAPAAPGEDAKLPELPPVRVFGLNGEPPPAPDAQGVPAQPVAGVATLAGLMTSVTATAAIPPRSIESPRGSRLPPPPLGTASDPPPSAPAQSAEPLTPDPNAVLSAAGKPAPQAKNPELGPADSADPKTPASVAGPAPETPTVAALPAAGAHAPATHDPALTPPANLPNLAPATSLASPTPVPGAPHVLAPYVPAVPLSGLAVEIAARLHEGKQRFEIRLDPPELGRIDVRLDLDRHGHVSSRLVVERSETLDLLRRDAPALERALQSAGLKTDGGIDFSLRDQAFARNRDTPEAHAPAAPALPDEEPAPALVQRGYWRWRGLGGDVDIRV
jgi:flagellar hook-length control protein FliK